MHNIVNNNVRGGVSFLVSSILLLVFTVSFVSAVELPTVGSDSNSWGTVLNRYLNVSLNETGHLRANNLSIGDSITFAFEEVIDNIIDGWLRVNGNLNVTGDMDISGHLSVYDLEVRSGQSITLEGAKFSNENYYTAIDTNWVVDNPGQPTAFLGIYADNGSAMSHANLVLESGGSSFNILKNSPLHPWSPNSSGVINEGSFATIVGHMDDISWQHFVSLDKDTYGNIEYLTGLESLMRLNHTALDLEAVDLIVNGSVTVMGVPLNDITFNPIVGYTSSSYDGDISNGSLVGYAAANAICGIEYSGSHFCLKSEVLKTIANGNYSFSGTVWFQNGPPGYTANADDCSGWTDGTSSYLGPFWNWDANAYAGKGALTNCGQSKKLMCCGGSS